MQINKNRILKKAKVFMATMMCALAFMGITSNVATVNVNAAESASDAYSKVTNSGGGVLGSDVQNKVTKISADAQSIVLTVVMGVLIITTLWTATKFSGAGDNPQKQAQLKTALMFQILGIVFVASYSGLILFGLKNLNLFG